MNKTELQELTALLETTWKKRNGETDQKMVDHCLKSGKYIKVDDMFVQVCDLKPSINTTIWYDDEGKDPGSGKKTFMHYNERMNMPKEYEPRFRYQDLHFIVQYWDDKTGGRLAGLAYKEENSTLPLIRKVTPEELEQINAAVSEVRADYAKRLETYYAKYSHKIHSSGYWANR